MEITILHGQNHKGSTYNITAMLKERLAGGNTIVHEYFMPKDGPAFCAGCFKCILKGEEYCPQADKVQGILASILHSEIIIVDSPTYCFEMTGQLKTLFDHFAYLWLSHRPKKEMFSKIGIVISTAAGAGAKRVAKSMAKQLFYWGVPVVHSVHLSVNAASWDSIPRKIKHKIVQKVELLSKKVKNQAGNVKCGIKTKIVFNIMRKMQKSNNWSLIDKNYWSENGWLEKSKPWK